MRVSVTCPTVYVSGRIHLSHALGVYCYESYWRYGKSRNGQKQQFTAQPHTWAHTCKFDSGIYYVRDLYRVLTTSVAFFSSVFTFHTINTTVVEYYRYERAIYITRLTGTWDKFISNRFHSGSNKIGGIMS